MFDRELSDAAAECVDAKPKQCYRNAVMSLVLADHWLLGDSHDLVYVEGTIIVDGLPIPFEHGWLELKDGTVIDPTSAVVQSSDTNVDYYPAVRFAPEVAQRRAIGRYSRLPLCANSEWLDQQAKAVYVACLQKMGGLTDEQMASTKQAFNCANVDASKVLNITE